MFDADSRKVFFFCFVVTPTFFRPWALIDLLVGSRTEESVSNEKATRRKTKEHKNTHMRIRYKYHSSRATKEMTLEKCHNIYIHKLIGIFSGRVQEYNQKG